MKKLNEYIIEKLQISSNSKVNTRYNYHPETKEELENLRFGN